MLPEAKGKFIRYLHEDDMLSANCIDDSLKAFAETGADFIHGNAEEFWSYKEDRQVYVPKIKNPTLNDMLAKNYIHSATLMYKREVFERLGGFDEKLNTAEEYEFSLRCLKAGMQLGYCPVILAHYRRHPLQKVRIVPRNEKIGEREMVRKRYRA
jgi:GT2 family glycosyltransferase